MTSAFENLAGPDKALRAEPPDAKEIAGLQRSALARLKDAQNAQLSVESRFDRPTTLLTPCAWRPCAGMVTVRAIASSFSNCCLIRWAWGRKYGVCYPSATTFETWANTRATSTWTNASRWT
jgi:hypothetical protein